MNICEIFSQNLRDSKVSDQENRRGHPGLNRGPLDLQSNALPLSYIPSHFILQRANTCCAVQDVGKRKHQNANNRYFHRECGGSVKDG